MERQVLQRRYLLCSCIFLPFYFHTTEYQRTEMKVPSKLVGAGVMVMVMVVVVVV